MYFGATFYWRILEKLFDFLSEMMNVLSSDPVVARRLGLYPRRLSLSKSEWFSKQSVKTHLILSNP